MTTGASASHEKTDTEVPGPLKKNLDWYIANQADLSAKYNGRILLIADQKPVAAFDSMDEACVTALKSCAPGNFTLQPCSPDSDSHTSTLYSPFYSAMIYSATTPDAPQPRAR